MKDGKISVEDIEDVLDELYESMAGDLLYVDGKIISDHAESVVQGASLLVDMIRNRLE